MAMELLRFRYVWLFIALVCIEVGTHQEFDSVHVSVYKYVGIDLRGPEFKPQRAAYYSFSALILQSIVYVYKRVK